jgi:beta-glucanase (GH16 family)
MLPFLSLLLLSCKQEAPAPVVPNLRLEDNLVAEEAGTVLCKVILSEATTEEVTFSYQTLDASALAGIDYEAVSGSGSIPAGQTEATFSIPLLNDNLREREERLTVQVYNLQKANSQKGLGFVAIRDTDTELPKATDGYITPASYPGFTLAWSDEFDGPEMSSAVYTFEQGNNNGWGNEELEFYTSNNHFFEDGKLIIEARNEGTASAPYYTSARIITRGKKEFKYGRIDIRAKLPTAKGIWPALWMLGGNFGQVGWPACGEIDIMELVGQAPDRVVGSAHWGSSFAVHKYKNSSYSISPDTYDEEFHVFSLAWHPDYMAWYMDDQLYFTFTPADTEGQPWPFNNPFFFIFNVAVGGLWPGPPDASTVFPQRMHIDYVRVFQR